MMIAIFSIFLIDLSFRIYGINRESIRLCFLFCSAVFIVALKLICSASESKKNIANVFTD